MISQKMTLNKIGIFVLLLVACATPLDTNSPNTSQSLMLEDILKKAVKQPLSSQNTPPVIQALSANPKDKIAKEGHISFTLEAFDPDRDRLKYYWKTDKGTLSKREGLDTYWQANTQSGIANIQLTVSDGKGGETNGTIKLFIQPDGQAQVKLIAKEECGENAKRFTEIYSQGGQP